MIDYSERVKLNVLLILSCKIFKYFKILKILGHMIFVILIITLGKIQLIAYVTE